MSLNQVRKFIENYEENISFVIGNGINRYNDKDNNRSWENLLHNLNSIDQVNSEPLIVKGFTYNEYFDMINAKTGIGSNSLNKSFIDLIKDWKPGTHHSVIVKYIMKLNATILTTNFDYCMAESVSSLKVHYDLLSEYYPWEAYHSERKKSKFRIYYINGMMEYYKSLRLGLNHYTASISKAREYLYSHEDSLYNIGENEWVGKDSWLHYFFHKNLIIFGLTLDTNEILLRWLLIQRNRYLKKIKKQELDCIYVHTISEARKKENHFEGRKLFLESMGVKTVQVKNYSEIYTGIFE